MGRPLELVYTDSSYVDRGQLRTFNFDAEYGTNAKNDFELKLHIKRRVNIKDGSLIYIEGTEFGGIVGQIGADTKQTKAQIQTYRGRTWHGVIEDKILEPDPGKDYLSVEGEANAVLQWLLNRMGLTDIFTASAVDSGFRIKHQFERHKDGYYSIIKMLASSGAKLMLKWDTGRVVLWAEAIKDYSKENELDSDRMAFSINKVFRPINHLVCLGKGELKDRLKIHFYADKNGKVSKTQSLFGINDRTAVYDYSNAEYAELEEKGRETLENCQNQDTCDVDISEGYVYEIGDIAGARNNDVDVSISATVSMKSVTIDRRGIRFGYDIGSTTNSSSFSGSSESSGGGGGETILAGYGLKKSGSTLTADVGLQELAGVEDIALSSRRYASDALTAVGNLEAIAVVNVTSTDQILVFRDGSTIAISHKDSGANPGAYGATEEITTPEFGGVINVGPRISIDAEGHVTGAAGRRTTIPKTEATPSARGLMSASDKTKLNNIAEGANNYTLPVATEDTIGGVKPDGVTVTISSDGKLTAQQGGAASFLAAHPINSLFWTEDARNPGEVYGGTWEEREWPYGFCFCRKG